MWSRGSLYLRHLSLRQRHRKPPLHYLPVLEMLWESQWSRFDLLRMHFQSCLQQCPSPHHNRFRQDMLNRGALSQKDLSLQHRHPCLLHCLPVLEMQSESWWSLSYLLCMHFLSCLQQCSSPLQNRFHRGMWNRRGLSLRRLSL